MNLKFWDRNKLKKFKERNFLIALVLGVVIGSFIFFLLNYYPVNKNIVFGVTFSKKYAEELGLDWQKAYLEILDDLQVKKIRLPVYWDDVEREIGRYSWEPYDWMIAEAEKRNVKLIVALGVKLPRWPECHIPLWATEEQRNTETEEQKNKEIPKPRRTVGAGTPVPRLQAGMAAGGLATEGLGAEKQRNEIEDLFLPFLRDAILRYRNYNSVESWQIENEPYFFREFGVCPEIREEFLIKEFDLAKQIGGRAVMSTESGEMGNWEQMINKVDILGISLYRVTWNKWVGYLFYPLTPIFYREKIRVLRPFFEDIVLSELQVEPWSFKKITEMPLDEQFKTMNLRQLKSNIDFSRRIGADEVYLWGVEWWYYMKNLGHDEFWREGEELFK